MAAISINIAEVEALRSTVVRRTADLAGLAAMVGGARGRLVVPNNDHAANDLTVRLRSIEQGIHRLASSGDLQGRLIGSYLERIVQLDRRRGWIPIGRILPPFRWRRPRILGPDRFRRICVGCEAFSRATRAFGSVKKAAFSLFSRGKQFVQSTTRSVTSTFRSGLNDYVLNPLRRIRSAIGRKWRQITGWFQEQWNKAWAAYQQIAAKLRSIVTSAVRTVVTAGTALARGAVTVYKLVMKEGRLIMTTKFETVEGDPNAKLEHEDDVEAYLTVDLSAVHVKVTATGTLEVKYFDDNTVEVTMGAELKAELVASLKAQGVGSEAEIEAAISAALGVEQTWRLKNTMIDGRPAYQIFIEQQIARVVLQIRAKQGGPLGFIAEQLLKRMPPEPTPTSSSVYMKLGAEVSATLAVGGLGAKAKASAELELRGTVDKDGTTYEFSSTISESTSGRSGGLSVGQGETISASYKLKVDPDGLPTEISVSLEHSHKTIGGATAGVKAEAGTVDTDTMTTTLKITPEMRSHMMDLIKRMPGSATELYHYLDDQAKQAEYKESHSSYDYVKTEVKAGGSGVEVGGSVTTKTNFRGDQ